MEDAGTEIRRSRGLPAMGTGRALPMLCDCVGNETLGLLPLTEPRFAMRVSSGGVNPQVVPMADAGESHRHWAHTAISVSMLCLCLPQQKPNDSPGSKQLQL